MIKQKFICTYKKKNPHGTVTEYILRDEYFKKWSLKADDLKNRIKTGQLEVLNLQIDTAGRLVGKSIKKVERKWSYNTVEKIWDNICKDFEGIEKDFRQALSDEINSNELYCNYEDNEVSVPKEKIKGIEDGIEELIKWISILNQMDSQFNRKLDKVNWRREQGWDLMNLCKYSGPNERINRFIIDRLEKYVKDLEKDAYYVFYDTGIERIFQYTSSDKKKMEDTYLDLAGMLDEDSEQYESDVPMSTLMLRTNLPKYKADATQDRETEYAWDSINY